jgi:hypothetical protein
MMHIYYGNMEEGNTYLIRKKYGSPSIFEFKVLLKTKYCFKVCINKEKTIWFYQSDMTKYDILDDLGKNLEEERNHKINSIIDEDIIPTTKSPPLDLDELF